MLSVTSANHEEPPAGIEPASDAYETPALPDELGRLVLSRSDSPDSVEARHLSRVSPALRLPTTRPSKRRSPAQVCLWLHPYSGVQSAFASPFQSGSVWSFLEGLRPRAGLDRDIGASGRL